MEVTAVLTDSATRFVGPETFSALTGRPAYVSLWDHPGEILHVRLADETDVAVVAPCTADTIAKLAQGLADDLLASTLLEYDGPLVLAPAMHSGMWGADATQTNVATLSSRGVRFVGPVDGPLAHGDTGPGRMSEPAEIADAVFAAVRPRDLDGARVLVTAGPTHEPIDPVRFIANRSSGKQGYAIASALADASATTVLVSGPVEIARPSAAKLVKVETARQMWAACEAELPVEIAVCTAAVADWRPAMAANSKIKKRDAALNISLVENPDILSDLAHHAKRPSLVIGFAAETDDLIANARAKLETKGCDWIVANDVGSG